MKNGACYHLVCGQNVECYKKAAAAKSKRGWEQMKEEEKSITKEREPAQGKRKRNNERERSRKKIGTKTIISKLLHIKKNNTDHSSWMIVKLTEKEWERRNTVAINRNKWKSVLLVKNKSKKAVKTHVACSELCFLQHAHQKTPESIKWTENMYKLFDIA